jgi:hypothetical protein
VRSGGRSFETIRYAPSGVHDGESMSCGPPWVGRSLLTSRGFDPSRSAIHRFSTPLRSLRNAIVLPSGENFGWLSNDMPPMMRRGTPPSIGSVYTSPSRSKTIVLPSALTSSDIHVPSSVVNSIVSAFSRTRRAGSSFFSWVRTAHGVDTISATPAATPNATFMNPPVTDLRMRNRTR